MTKHQTKAQKFADLHTAYKCTIAGESFRRENNKDGSISTKPTVTVEEKPEAEVLKDCIEWLRQHGIVADRMNVGAGDFGGGFRKYGIEGAGDIIAIMPNGRHLEVECKAGKGGRWSLAQQKRATKIERNNAVYVIAHGVEELEEKMRYINE
jgi:hypothetical protein